MKFKYIILISFLLLTIHQALGQNVSKKTQLYSGIFLEYATLIITHDIKLYSDLNFYRNEKVIMSLQPGFEFISSLQGTGGFFPGSPYYDINFLSAIQLFPNYGISLKPFVGLSFRLNTKEYEDESSFFYLKYGTTLDLNVAQEFKIIGKIMNVPTNNSNGTEVDLFVALIKTIQDTSKQTQDMVRAVADNQKMLYSMLKKVMEKLEINYDA